MQSEQAASKEEDRNKVAAMLADDRAARADDAEDADPTANRSVEALQAAAEMLEEMERDGGQDDDDDERLAAALAVLTAEQRAAFLRAAAGGARTPQHGLYNPTRWP